MASACGRLSVTCPFQRLEERLTCEGLATEEVPDGPPLGAAQRTPEMKDPRLTNVLRERRDVEKWSAGPCECDERVFNSASFASVTKR